MRRGPASRNPLGDAPRASAGESAASSAIHLSSGAGWLSMVARATGLRAARTRIASLVVEFALLATARVVDAVAKST